MRGSWLISGVKSSADGGKSPPFMVPKAAQRSTPEALNWPRTSLM